MCILIYIYIDTCEYLYIYVYVCNNTYIYMYTEYTYIYMYLYIYVFLYLLIGLVLLNPKHVTKRPPMRGVAFLRSRFAEYRHSSDVCACVYTCICLEYVYMGEYA